MFSFVLQRCEIWYCSTPVYRTQTIQQADQQIRPTATTIRSHVVCSVQAVVQQDRTARAKGRNWRSKLLTTSRVNGSMPAPGRADKGTPSSRAFLACFCIVQPSLYLVCMTAWSSFELVHMQHPSLKHRISKSSTQQKKQA